MGQHALIFATFHEDVMRKPKASSQSQQWRKRLLCPEGLSTVKVNGVRDRMKFIPAAGG